EPCICGSAKFFDKCDECAELKGTGIRGAGDWGSAWCYFWETDIVNPDFYYVKDKCTRADGKTLGYYTQCESLHDCFGNPNPCGGKMLCEDDEGAEGEVACECGGKKYFNKCKEMCQYKVNNTGIKFHETSEWFTKYGWYMDGVVCTRLDGSKVGYRKQCNATTTDASGNIPPCAGMVECPSGSWGSGDGCSCGGKVFFNSCVSECTFEDTAETCAAKGQSFEPKCYGSKNGKQTWFGECK
ncbi:MAG: hypothetical protein Q4F75_02065, partial [Pseudomonadota bacterium]|nr:hypothetical protein [Pseudomonadota bacterium]